MPEETDWARYKRLPPDERDRLGFRCTSGRRASALTAQAATHGDLGTMHVRCEKSSA